MTQTSAHPPSPSHFKGKEAIDHVIEAQVQGKIAAAEIHGTEIPGHISAGADAARETALVLLLIWGIFIPLNQPPETLRLLLMIFSCGWILWKLGRSSWLGWSRLERLHRILEQEKYEIEHHRQQEREELKVLYAAKGFEGKLLEDVLDVLMADGDRLLRVMIEEELGLTLEEHEHPLKQGLGAGIGALIAIIISFIGLFLYPSYGILIAALIVIGCAAATSAHYQQNHFIPAIIWNIGLAVLSFGCVFFLGQYFFPLIRHHP